MIMRRLFTISLAAAAVVGCTGPTDPAPRPLDGIWVLDTSTAGLPPRQLTLAVEGTSVTGTGSAMGVDVPIGITVTGSFAAQSAGDSGTVTLHLAYDLGYQLTADFTGTLSPAGRLEGSVVYYGLTNAPDSGQLTFTRPPPTATGLEGTVTRGPVTPVCRVGVPCYAPFSAAFTVSQGQLVVARFQSDSAGHYEVLLAPGTYAIVPDSGAPVFPGGQSRPATVGPAGITRLDLQFDTGIR